MASLKIASLLIKTVSKPIANKLKQQAQEHPTFRSLCIWIAQAGHRSEVRMRLGLLNESPTKIKPLNEAKAIQSGANTIAETFLFCVAAGLILGESYRSSRSASNRKADVDDKLESLRTDFQEMKAYIEVLHARLDQNRETEERRSEVIEGVLERLLKSSMKAGWNGLGGDNTENGQNSIMDYVKLQSEQDRRRSSWSRSGVAIDDAPTTTEEEGLMVLTQENTALEPFLDGQSHVDSYVEAQEVVR